MVASDAPGYVVPFWCVGLSEEPIGDWFCPDCSGYWLTCSLEVTTCIATEHHILCQHYTTDWERLVKAAVTSFWSMVAVPLSVGLTIRNIGKVPWNLCPITHSTCMQTQASCLDFCTSTLGSCDFPFCKGWDFKPPITAKSSWMLKPHSRTSPYSMWLRTHFWVITLSETRPPHAFEVKDIEPVGATAIIIFTVFLLALAYYTWSLSCLCMRQFSFSHVNSPGVSMRYK